MKVHIVTIREIVSRHDDEIDAVAFDSHQKAEAWIESQIDTYVNDLKLDRETAVDGWEIELEGDRTIRYSIVERELQTVALKKETAEGSESADDVAKSNALDELIEKKRHAFDETFADRYGIKLLLLQGHCNPQGQRFVDVDFLCSPRKTAEEIKCVCENIAKWIGGEVCGTVNFDFAGRPSLSFCVEMFDDENL